MRRYETFHHAREILPWQTKSIFFITPAPLREFFFLSIAGNYLFVEKRM